MIKAKFGDSLKSKTDTAMVNESLCKVLCHNVCCLIQSHCELGIEAKFWGQQAENPRDTAGDPALTGEAESWDWV